MINLALSFLLLAIPFQGIAGTQEEAGKSSFFGVSDGRGQSASVIIYAGPRTGKIVGVETTPALFLVRPGGNGGAIQLGQGILSGEEIIRRAITLAHQNNWLNDGEYDGTLKVKPMQVDTQTIQNIDQAVMDNPSELVKTIRDNLRKQF